MTSPELTLEVCKENRLASIRMTGIHGIQHRERYWHWMPFQAGQKTFHSATRSLNCSFSAVVGLDLQPFGHFLQGEGSLFSSLSSLSPLSSISHSPYSTAGTTGVTLTLEFVIKGKSLNTLKFLSRVAKKLFPFCKNIYFFGRCFGLTTNDSENYGC